MCVLPEGGGPDSLQAPRILDPRTIDEGRDGIALEEILGQLLERGHQVRARLQRLLASRIPPETARKAQALLRDLASAP